MNMKKIYKQTKNKDLTYGLWQKENEIIFGYESNVENISEDHFEAISKFIAYLYKSTDKIQLNSFIFQQTLSEQLREITNHFLETYFTDNYTKYSEYKREVYDNFYNQMDDVNVLCSFHEKKLDFKIRNIDNTKIEILLSNSEENLLLKYFKLDNELLIKDIYLQVFECIVVKNILENGQFKGVRKVIPFKEITEIVNMINSSNKDKKTFDSRIKKFTFNSKHAAIHIKETDLDFQLILHILEMFLFGMITELEFDKRYIEFIISSLHNHLFGSLYIELNREKPSISQ